MPQTSMESADRPQAGYTQEDKDQAMADYRAAADAEREKTARLKALRLEKEAAAKKAAARKARAKKRKSSSSEAQRRVRPK